MLNSLRQYATGWVAQVLLGILVISFAVWGVADIFTGFHANDIARVGSVEITVTDFSRDYDSAVQNYSRQFGRALSPDQARQMGIPSQVLGRLVNQALLDNTALQMNLGISNEELGRVIATDPTFFGPSGTFDRGQLNAVIRQQGYTEDSFILERREEQVRAQLASSIAGGVTSPAAYLKALHTYRTEERNISYVLLAAPSAAEIPEPTEADLAPFYDAHRKDYDAPEVRGVSYFVLSPASLSKAEEVSDEDARKLYDEHSARWTTAETRKVEQIVFDDRADADAAIASLASGKTFDDLLTERNLKPSDVDLGVITKDKIADPTIADAAFSLAANTTSAVIDGRFGPAILRVTTINPQVVTPFDTAKIEIKKEIAEQRAATEVGEIHDAIEDARAAGSTLAEVASKYDLKLVTVPGLDEAGKDIDGAAVPGLPQGLAAAAFQSEVGIENDPIQPDRTTYIWYEVTTVTQPRERPLAEVRDTVVAAWKDVERAKRLTTQAEAIKQRLDNKEDLATVAASAGLTVKTATKLTRITTPTGDISAAALADAFNGPDGTIAVADGAQPMTKLVLVVTGTSLPAYVDNSPEIAQTKEQLDSQFVNSLLGLYLGGLQNKTDVKLNQIALQQALGISDTID